MAICLFVAMILYRRLKRMDRIRLFGTGKFIQQLFGSSCPAITTSTDPTVHTVIHKYFYLEVLFKYLRKSAWGYLFIWLSMATLLSYYRLDNWNILMCHLPFHINLCNVDLIRGNLIEHWRCTTNSCTFL